MTTGTKACCDEALSEFDSLPEEYLQFLLQILGAFLESLPLKSAADSFRQGWCEAQSRVL